MSFKKYKFKKRKFVEGIVVVNTQIKQEGVLGKYERNFEFFQNFSDLFIDNLDSYFLILVKIEKNL